MPQEDKHRLLEYNINFSHEAVLTAELQVGWKATMTQQHAKKKRENLRDLVRMRSIATRTLEAWAIARSFALKEAAFIYLFEATEVVRYFGH